MIRIKSIFSYKKTILIRFFVTEFNGYLLLGALLFGLSYSPSHAVATEDTPLLTLSEAIQRTFNSHPELQVFQYKIKAQRGRVIQSDLSPKPVVELNLEDTLGSGNFRGIDSAQTTLSVTWVLDNNIKEKRTALATRELILIESERAIKQLDTATQTARYFVKTLSYQESTVIANRAIVLAETTIKEIKKRIKVGKTPVVELYRAEAELAKRKLVLVDLKHDMKSSLRALAAQWGSSKPTFNSVSGSLMSQPKVISFHALKSRITNNPSLAKFHSLERIKQAELKLAQEERNPMWKFSTGVRRYERTNDFGVVAGISIPFGGNNRNQGRIAEVQAKISQNQSEADALRVRIETSLFIVYQQLEHSLHLSDMLKQDIIPKLEKALTETRKAYELGKYSYLEWMAVQNDLLDAQSALLEANLAAHINKIELERLTGTQITSPF
jgi:cobalt-zinc-cadmium efflux system outer membrane protein